VPDPDSVEANACAHRNNHCGTWNLPCRKAILKEASKMYFKETDTFTTDGAFQQNMKIAPTAEDCEADRFLMEMELRGSWRHERASRHINDTSMMTTEVTQAWLQIIQEEMCMEDKGYVKDDAPPMCFNTSYVLKDICRCNNWPFIMDGDFIKRNIVMFCRPPTECPLLMSQIIKRPRFVLYNASRKKVCWYRPDPTPTRGWGQGLKTEDYLIDPPTCVFKVEHDDCLGTNEFVARGGRAALAALLAAVLLQW
jgi:hypothetical protein